MRGPTLFSSDRMSNFSKRYTVTVAICVLLPPPAVPIRYPEPSLPSAVLRLWLRRYHGFGPSPARPESQRRVCAASTHSVRPLRKPVGSKAVGSNAPLPYVPLPYPPELEDADTVLDLAAFLT